MANYEELDQLKAKLENLRPLDDKKLKAIKEKFQLEWTYHSNAIEGNPLTLGETSFFIREGLTSKGKPLSAYLEASNHVEALDYLESVVREKTPITQHLIRQYHSMLFKKIDSVLIGKGEDSRKTPIVGGEYKKENNHVIRLDGQILNFTDPLQVPGDLERLVTWLQNESEGSHPIERASNLHHRFVLIHPFVDGNGRVARLLMNTVLMQSGYTPAIIPVEEKKRYLEALQLADAGNYAPLNSFIEEQVARTLRLMIDVLEGREAFDLDDVARMVRNLAERGRNLAVDLGTATVPSSSRATQTARDAMIEVGHLLAEHVKKASNQDLPLTFEPKGVSMEANTIHNKAVEKVGMVSAIPGLAVSTPGNKRLVPQARAAFYCVVGRYQIAMVGAVKVSTLNEKKLEEEWQYRHDASGMHVGSIFAEDWSKETIYQFVVQRLKSMYQVIDVEMEVRRKILSEEEERVAKFRIQENG